MQVDITTLYRPAFSRYAYRDFLKMPIHLKNIVQLILYLIKYGYKNSILLYFLFKIKLFYI